jgi:hypothetical protein
VPSAKNILATSGEGILAPLDHFSQVDDKHLCIFTFFPASSLITFAGMPCEGHLMGFCEICN